MSQCVSLCSTPTFAMRPSTALLLVRAHMEAITLRREWNYREKPTELEPSYNHSLLHLDLHTWTPAQKHIQPSKHTDTHTRRYRGTDGHTHSHRSSAATLPEAVHFHCSLCWDKAAVCFPPCLPSPGLEWDGARAVNSSERAVKSASIKTGGPVLAREEPTQ